MWPWKKKSKGYYRGPRRATDEEFNKEYTSIKAVPISKPSMMINVHQMYPDGYEKLEYPPMYSEEWWREKLNETMNEEKEKTMNDVKLASVKLKKDERGYYLRLKYIQDTDDAISEVIIPKYRLKIWEDRICINHPTGYRVHEAPDANIGFGYWELDKGWTEHIDDKEVYYSVKTLKEKVHKMTVADIEKKLGYKIEIVSEEKEG